MRTTLEVRCSPAPLDGFVIVVFRPDGSVVGKYPIVDGVVEIGKLEPGRYIVSNGFTSQEVEVVERAGVL